jgi:hypothetical protein
MIRERCSCGSEIETDDEDAYALILEWREQHKCRPTFDNSPTTGFAQVETAPDFRFPELHIGFRSDPE